MTSRRKTPFKITLNRYEIDMLQALRGGRGISQTIRTAFMETRLEELVAILRAWPAQDDSRIYWATVYLDRDQVSILSVWVHTLELINFCSFSMALRLVIYASYCRLQQTKAG